MPRVLVCVLAGFVLAASALSSTIAASADTGELRAGFATRTITPAGDPGGDWNFWENPATGFWSEPFSDEDGDGCWDSGESFTDDPRNTLIDPGSAGKWDGIWTNAGFDSMCPQGILDDTWARAVVVSQGGRTVAMVSLDVVGFFNEEIRRAQKEYLYAHPDKPLDALIVASTHTHEGADTMGLWGWYPHEESPFPIDGKFPLYQAYIRSRIVEAVAEAYTNLEAADVAFAHATHTTGQRDGRLPHIVDPDLWTARFVAEDGTSTIGTIVNWSNHPESMSGNQPLVSSDFPHGTRTRMEAEFGAPSVYFSGSVGGMMTPLGTDVPGFGMTRSYERTFEIGRLVAESAIDALDGAVVLDDQQLQIAHEEFFIPIDNQALRAANAIGVFDKPGYTAGLPAGPAGQDILTEMYAVTLGPAVFVTVPGELLPEIALGVYPERECEGADTGRPHEPGIRAQFEEASYHFVLGLGMDELGYIVPGYDFWAWGVEPRTDREPVGSDGDPVVFVGGIEAEDPCGEGHYEETVSASSVMAPLVACHAASLAGKNLWSTHAACSEENTTVGPMGVNPRGLDPEAP